MRILVIEDDASVRETLGMVLEAYNHNAMLVDTGEKAVDFLSREWPDVMLLDLTLEGMTGEEVYHEIQNHFGKVPPTVVISAAQQGASRARHNMPGTFFLAKPYTIEQLDQILFQAAGSAQGAA